MQKQISQIQIQQQRESIDLAEINKYVGYRSKTLQVSLASTEGYLKKLVNEVSRGQFSIFPLRYYMFNRVSGEFTISNKPDAAIKHRFSLEEIKCVKEVAYLNQIDKKREDKDLRPNDYPFLFLLETTSRTFYLYAKTIEEK